MAVNCGFSGPAQLAACHISGPPPRKCTPRAAELEHSRDPDRPLRLVPGGMNADQLGWPLEQHIRQSGQIDYLAIYRSDALEEHLKYIALPTQINLSDPAMAAAYAKVTINAGPLGTLTAKPIIYGLTIPSTAPDAALGQKFIAYYPATAPVEI